MRCKDNDQVWQTRQGGDLVLATLPPYMFCGTIVMGIPILSTLLESAGIRSRIIRFDHVPTDAPPAVMNLTHGTLWGDPPMDDRIARMREVAQTENEFFEAMVERLLAGGERVVGLSVWRLNADVTLEVARRLKERRPDVLILVGGPETSAAPEDLRTDWIDVIVSGQAEGVAVPVVRAMLLGRPADALEWDNVWVNPRHGTSDTLVRRHAPLPPLPRVDYSKIVPLLVGAPQPTIPVILNQGCPFRCGFCPNTTMYPEMTWGNVARVVDEMVEIMGTWKGLFRPGEDPGLEILICDAALNSQPAQFDALCDALIETDWPLRPKAIVTTFIIDSRMTPHRVSRMLAAGMKPSFFGLESANPRIRRAMKKPGKMKDVRATLQAFADEGARRSLRTGIVVGWPDETEEEFHETIEFVEWMSTLDILDGLGVHPLMRINGMMDSDVLRDATGEKHGIDWKLPTIAGDPAVRARRHFYVFEHFKNLEVISFLPHQFVLEKMLGGGTPFWQHWVQHNQRSSHEYREDSQPAQEGVEIHDRDQGSDAHSTTAPELLVEDQVQHDADPATPREEGAPDWSVRELTGRGATVIVRLSKEATTVALARGHSHGFSYEGGELPPSLRPVMLKLGRSFGQLPTTFLPTDELWTKLEKLVQQIAPDLVLRELSRTSQRAPVVAATDLAATTNLPNME